MRILNIFFVQEFSRIFFKDLKDFQILSLLVGEKSNIFRTCFRIRFPAFCACFCAPIRGHRLDVDPGDDPLELDLPPPSWVFFWGPCSTFLWVTDPWFTPESELAGYKLCIPDKYLTGILLGTIDIGPKRISGGLPLGGSSFGGRGGSGVAGFALNVE